jgi:hypothetical protein
MNLRSAINDAPARLAVVLPAWRGRHLATAIASLRIQTDRRFRLYVEAGPGCVAAGHKHLDDAGRITGRPRHRPAREDARPLPSAIIRGGRERPVCRPDHVFPRAGLGR